MRWERRGFTSFETQVPFYLLFKDTQRLKTKKITIGGAEEVANCLVGDEDKYKEEELLRQAIALSEENENDEEELLRQAIALSLED